MVHASVCKGLFFPWESLGKLAMAMPVTMESTRFTYSKTVSRGRSIYLCLPYYYVTLKERKVKKKSRGEDGTDKTLSVIKNPRKKRNFLCKARNLQTACEEQKLQAMDTASSVNLMYDNTDISIRDYF